MYDAMWTSPAVAIAEEDVTSRATFESGALIFTIDAEPFSVHYFEVSTTK